MKLISIGFGSTVCAERVLAVIAPESAPIKRLIQEARERGMLIDASFGRKTKSVLLMDTDHVLLSSVSPSQLPVLCTVTNASAVPSGFTIRFNASYAKVV